ncbi:MAG: GumC family protein [Terriglobia bacterium]
MLTGRQLGMDDYWAIFRRRAWIIAIPVILGPVIAVLIARRLPPKYTSNSMILIEQPKVPPSIVPSVVGDDLMSRLANMEEQILSRSKLQPLIERYGLYKKDWNSVPMEQLVARMREAIIVKPVSFSNDGTVRPNSENQLPGFQISFTAADPSRAQAICNEITSMFVDQNLRLREQRAQGTADFIQTQLVGAKQRLDEQDAKLAAFKRRYFGALPDQEQSTIQIVGALTAQLNSLRDGIGRYQEDRNYTEALLAQETAAWKASQTGNSPQTLQQQLSAAENHLMDLQTRYTDSYPDVIKAKQDIVFLKKQIAQRAATEKASAGAKSAPSRPLSVLSMPPQIRQLRLQLHSIEEAIRGDQRDEARLRREIASYEGKLRMAPSVEQQYKDITRNYQTALDFYNSLLSKEDISRMSTSLERRQEGQQFVILDPADLPVKPSFPDKVRFAGGGLIAGLIVGFGIVLLIEMRDKALQDERDVEYFLGVPTLALIPEVSGAVNGNSNGHSRFLGRLRRKPRMLKTPV